MGPIFTYLLTYGGAAASLYNPWYGLLVYFCFAIIQPESMWYWSITPGNYSRIVAVALLIGWALRGCGNWNFGRAKPIVYALLGYFGWGILSACFAKDTTQAWPWIEEMAKIVLPFIVGLTLADSREKLRQLAWVLALSQAYVALELNRSYYSGYNRLVDSGFGGMDNNCVSIAMVAGVGLMLFLGLSESAWWRKGICFAGVGLMMHVPLFGMSRGGMLGLMVTGTVAFVLIRKKMGHYLVFAAAVLLGIRLAGPAVIARFSTTMVSKEEELDDSAKSRLELWACCWQLMQEYPVIGVGPKNFLAVATNRFHLPHQAHSLWMQTGAEMGVLGLGFLIAFYALTIGRLAGLLYRKHAPEPVLDMARMVIASLVGFAVSVSFVSLIALEIPYYVVLIGAGVLRLSALSEPVVVDGSDTEELVKPTWQPEHQQITVGLYS